MQTSVLVFGLHQSFQIPRLVKVKHVLGDALLLCYRCIETMKGESKTIATFLGHYFKLTLLWKEIIIMFSPLAEKMLFPIILSLV